MLIGALGSASAKGFGFATQTGPTVIGQSYGGGYYAGKIDVSGTQYYLIVAPKATGEDSTAQWKTSNTSTSGTSSVIDGPTNSSNMNNASHPAAQFCEGLSIGGYTDWYMPAKNELEVLYYYFKPTTTSNSTISGSNANAVSPEPVSTNYTTGAPAQTTITAYQTGNSEAFATTYYRSSTEYDATGAWSQSFSQGLQSNTLKSDSYYVRAVRRILV